MQIKYAKHQPQRCFFTAATSGPYSRVKSTTVLIVTWVFVFANLPLFLDFNDRMKMMLIDDKKDAILLLSPLLLQVEQHGSSARQQQQTETEQENKIEIQANKAPSLVIPESGVAVTTTTNGYRNNNDNKNKNDNNNSKITITEAGVDVSDPELYATTVDLQGDSSTATVMGMATGYNLGVYKRFVGSLRNTGYQGHIILGLAPSPGTQSSLILRYLQSRNVTVKILKYAPCNYTQQSDTMIMDTAQQQQMKEIFQGKQCAHPYSDIKTRWSRFPLQRDWLMECTTCTGPVLTIDVRDSFFQMDPFGPGSPPITGLQVFQEHPNQTTSHRLVKFPVRHCKNMTFDEPMLCSGSTIGTRAAMIKYFEVMYAEMKVWIGQQECRFGIDGDDQSIHNYLFYTGQLPFASSIPHRTGIVNTAGWEGSKLFQQWRQEGMNQRGLAQDVAAKRPFPGAELTNNGWIGLSYNLTDDDGFLTQYDGTRSRVVHQADRFGYYFWYMWLSRQKWADDRTFSRARMIESGSTRRRRRH
ncbi:hypothetical protein ACA910_002037 [Epithemia clementina (nom. ined.)]